MQFELIVLCISFTCVIYSYFLYPVILLLLPKKNIFNFNSAKKSELPFITLIITAYNEESRIVDKINNTLAISYPKNKREILIASDGSTDKTNAHVNKFSETGVRLINVTERKGKENAQLAAIKEAKGDILIFSDVATQIPSDSIQHIVTSFDDNKIGAISSEDRFISDDGNIAGEGAYVKYEMWLRRLEARVNSLVGLSGSFFACRKIVTENWNISVPSDFNTALNCTTLGLIAASNPNVLGYYPNLKDESKEYQRKLRTVIRGMAAIAEKPSILNPFKFGLFSFEVISHKIMRWLVPWFQILLLSFSLILWQSHILLAVLLTSQLCFYSLAFIGWLSSSARTYTIIKIPFFFMQVNVAIAHAGIQFLVGKRITKWEPSKR